MLIDDNTKKIEQMFAYKSELCYNYIKQTFVRNEVVDLKALTILKWDRSKLETEVRLYENKSLAIENLKTFYREKIKNFDQIDWEGTYVSDDLMYGQISHGAKRVELIIGEVKSNFV